MMMNIDSTDSLFADTKYHAEDKPVTESKITLNKEWLDYFSRSEEHTSELQSRENLVCRLLLEKKKRTLQPRRHRPGGAARHRVPRLPGTVLVRRHVHSHTYGCPHCSQRHQPPPQRGPTRHTDP